MALADSLALKRMHKQLQHTLPRDAKLAVASDEVFNAIRGGINALGDDALRQAAAIFAKHDLNGDGSLSARELMHMKTELRSVLPAGAPALPMPAPGQSVSFIDFCKRVAAQKSAVSHNADAAASSAAVHAEATDLMRVHGRENGTLGLLEFRKVMQALGDQYGWDGGSVTALRRFHEIDSHGTGELGLDDLSTLLARLHVRQGRDPSPTATRKVSMNLAATTSSVGSSSGSGMFNAQWDPNNPAPLPRRAIDFSKPADQRSRTLGRSVTLSNLLAGEGSDVRTQSTAGGMMGQDGERRAQTWAPSFQGINSRGQSTVFDPEMGMKRTTRDPFLQQRQKSIGPKDDVGGQKERTRTPTPEPAVQQQAKQPVRRTANEKYAENLLANAEASMAQRDALEGLPVEEKNLIIDVFMRFDPQVKYLLNEQGESGQQAAATSRAAAAATHPSMCTLTHSLTHSLTSFRPSLPLPQVLWTSGRRLSMRRANAT